MLQPWAWALIHGGKNVENRSWTTRDRGRIWIHAGMREIAGDVEGAVRLAAMTSGRSIEQAAEHYRRHRDLGAVIGSMDLVDCLRHDALTDGHPLVDSPWAQGPWLWVLESPVACEPRPGPGERGLWTLPRPPAP